MKEILKYIKESAIDCYKNLKDISIAFLFFYFPNLIALSIFFFRDKSISVILSYGIIVTLVAIAISLIGYGFIGEWARSILKNKEFSSFKVVFTFLITGFFMSIVSFVYFLIGYLPIITLAGFSLMLKKNLFVVYSIIPSMIWIAFFTYFSIGGILNFLKEKKIKKGFAVKKISKRIFRLEFLIAFLISVIIYLIPTLLGLAIKPQEPAQVIVGKAITTYIYTFCLAFSAGLLARTFKK